jgi:hypothetical protein
MPEKYWMLFMDFIAENRRDCLALKFKLSMARIKLWSPKRQPRKWLMLGAVLQCIETRFENVNLPKLS